MTSIDLHIERLLATRSYVSVPGLGAFVSRRVPAAIEGDTVSAPALTTAFDHYPSVVDDGLTASVARAAACDTAQAEGIVEGDVQFVNQQLALEGRYTIDGVGTLVRNADGSIGFESQAAATWLPTLTLEPLAAPEAAPAETTVPVMSEAFAKSLRRTASSAAAIAIFAFLTFLFTQLPLGRNGADEPLTAALAPTTATARPTIDYTPSSPLVIVLNTPTDASEPVAATPAEPSEPVAAASETALPEASAASTATAPAITAKTAADSTMAAKAAATSAGSHDASAADGRYCLIVASLANADEAAKYLATAPSDLQLVVIDGHYRISALTGDSYAAVYRAATSAGLLTRYPSAWICRR